MTKENFKSLALVLLCALTVMMLTSLWAADSLFVWQQAEELAPVNREDVSYILDPETVNVSFGGGTMTTFFFDSRGLFTEFKPSFYSGLTRTSQVRQISASEYFKERKLKSIEFILPSVMSMTDFLSLIKNDSYTESPPLEQVKRILLPAYSVTKFYVYDGDAYYELTTKGDMQSAMLFVNAIFDSKDFVPYDTIFNRFSLDADQDQLSRQELKNVLVPLRDDGAMTSVRAINEVDADDLSTIRSYAAKVFGQNLNFVQEATDVNNAKIMLYGYGEKALRVSPEGLIEYTEKLSEGNEAKRHLINDLNTALNLIEDLGGDNQYYLKAVTPLTQKNAQGYRFEFYLRMNDYRVVQPGQDVGIIVEVYGSQVTTYRRNMRTYLTTEPAVKVSDVDQFFNMLNHPTNFERLRQDYLSSQEDASTSTLPDYKRVLAAIDAFDIVYVLRSNNTLRPAYVFKLGTNTYYFDYFNHRLLND